MLKIRPSRLCGYFALTSLLVIFLIAVGYNTELLQDTRLLPSVTAAVILCGVTITWRDIRWRAKRESRTASALIITFIARGIIGWLGKRQRNRLEADTLDVRRVQEETLLKRLHKTANTDYGRQYDFKSIKDCETFRQHHPITVYENYRDLVEQVAAGESRLLIAEKPHLLVMTSGISGKCCMLPRMKDTNTDLFLQGVAVCLDTIKRSFPASEVLQRTTGFYYDSNSGCSETGIPIRSNISILASSCSTLLHHLLSIYTTPAPALQVRNKRDALYLHLLFALRDSALGALESDFASEIFDAFSSLQERWQELVEDVELGRVSPQLDLEHGTRKTLEGLLRPDPERAAHLRAEFEKGFLGIAPRLWPRLSLILAVDSGSDQIHGELLRQHYCEGVPFYSPVYAAAEGLIGVNVCPEKEPRQYLLCPRSMFCEFVPEASLEEEQPPTLTMEQVQQGQCYELVVTNASGLFRYRIGDVLRITAFHNQCPVVEFQYRRGQMLNVRGERISEAMFLGSLKRAVSQWPGAELLDYCCVESSILGQASGGSDPHYQVFLELRGVRNLTEEQRYKLDHCLQEHSAVYKSFRFKGSIGPMRVQLVGRGAFLELRSSLSSLPPATFKMQRVLRSKECADFLLRRTIS
uniref:GH3 domain containing n=1 Tax=Paramormyrops kingsleyae TaxID=1676925 RepID=A0A3B3R883_9TELE|nr:GH3 domain-containing protein isoform X2 [Paramormyrops kingsleyae]